MINSEQIGTTTLTRRQVNLESDQQKLKTAERVGSRLNTAEADYLKALRSGDQKEIVKAEIAFQRAVRIFEGFRQTMSNTFQIVMGAIRALRVG